MSPLDRNKKRITTIQNAMRAGRLSREEGERQIAKIEAEGPRIVARYEDPLGREHTEPAASWEEAERIEAARKREIDAGSFVAPKTLDTALVTILDFYLTKKMMRNGKPRESFKNARAHRDHALRLLGGKLTLRMLLQDPAILTYHFRQAPAGRASHKFYQQIDFASGGSTLNYLITLSSATAYFLKKNLIQAANPFDVLDRTWKKGHRKQKFTWVEHCHLVDIAKGLDASTGKPFPAWLAVYFEAGWETGWRAGEVQDWVWERVTLDPSGDDFPWIKTLVEKQGAELPVYEEKPITWRLAGLLKALPADQKERGRIFLGKRSTVDKTARRALNQAGLSDRKFHDYRRTMRDRVKLIEGQIPPKLGHDYQGWNGEAMPARYETERRKALEQVLKALPGQNRDKSEAGTSW